MCANQRGNSSGALALSFGCNRPDRLAHGTARSAKRCNHRHWRPLFEGSKYGCIIEGEADELVVGAHRFDHVPLARAEHLYRERLKMPEDPDKIKPLREGRLEIPRPERS